MPTKGMAEGADPRWINLGAALQNVQATDVVPNALPNFTNDFWAPCKAPKRPREICYEACNTQPCEESMCMDGAWKAALAIMMKKLGLGQYYDIEIEDKAKGDGEQVGVQVGKGKGYAKGHAEGDASSSAPADANMSGT